MTAPTNTYSIRLELPLGNVPQVNESNTDPDLYKELLDIHDSIIAIASGLEENASENEDFINKFRNVVTIDVGASPYAVQTTNGLIRVNAAAGNISVILPTPAATTGYEYKVKRIDTAPTTNTVTVTAAGGALIDMHTGGVLLSPLSSYTFKAAAPTRYDIV